MARVLVVDDDADVLHLVWTQMRARGHLVLGASSGPEALEAVQLWGAPQVAVLDVAMPAMDGLELLEQLRAGTGIAEPPAIFLSPGSTARPSRRRTGWAPPSWPSRSWRRSCTPHRGRPGPGLRGPPDGRRGGRAPATEPLTRAAMSRSSRWCA